MGTYQHDATVHTDPQSLFAYLADVDNLPEYFSAMESARTTAPGEVYVVANVEGVRREGSAWLLTDSEARTMRWGSEGANDYHGEL